MDEERADSDSGRIEMDGRTVRPPTDGCAQFARDKKSRNKSRSAEYNIINTGLSHKVYVSGR